jgi:hypothetical protein
MAQPFEESIARKLRAILAPLPVGALIVETQQSQAVLGGLEYYLPQILHERHPEWKYESLDGFLPVVSRKTGVNEAEFFGQCILMSDQALTPIQVHLQVDIDRDEISWLECRLGKRVCGQIAHIPYRTDWPVNLLLDAAEHVDAIDWFYAVTFGERRIT